MGSTNRDPISTLTNKDIGLVKELKEMGFEINPYDTCMANKLMNKKQMTVRWHVDDLMISHVDKGETLKFVKCINGVC